MHKPVSLLHSIYLSEGIITLTTDQTKKKQTDPSPYYHRHGLTRTTIQTQPRPFFAYAADNDYGLIQLDE